MTDKPDWERALGVLSAEMSAAAAYRSQDGGTSMATFQRLYQEGKAAVEIIRSQLASTAHLEAAVAKAKAEVLREVDETVGNQWAGGTGDPPELSDAYDQVIATLLAKYSEPTAVAATEKEG